MSESEIITKKVKCSDFVKRQTKESGFSHFNGTWEELEVLVEDALHKEVSIRPGYKDGVILVDLPGQMFYSAIVDLDKDSQLVAGYAPRREGEAPYIRIGAKANKQLANYASAVLYRWDILSEDNDWGGNAEWEIIAIKARILPEEEPMDPYTMARNFLHLKGGTKGDFTAQQFAESILYWNNHCMAIGKPKWYKTIINWYKSNFPSKEKNVNT